MSMHSTCSHRPTASRKPHLRRRAAALSVIMAMVLALTATAHGVVATGPNGSNAQAVHALGYTGQGVNVGVISGSNARVTHEAFYDKDPCGLPTGSSHAHWHDATTAGAGTYYIGPNGHDTWIAGVLASRGGLTHPTDIGVAPGADIYSERVATTAGGISSTYVENALDNLVAHGCRVVYTGFQITPPTADPNGASIWTRLYDYYADTHNIVFANAAGNRHDGNGTLLTNNVSVFGDAYNGITTGGLAVVEPAVWRMVGYESLPGLTGDERRKPDLVAPSQNQTMPDYDSDNDWTTWTSAGGHTSLSVPHAAGVAAMLLEYADSTSAESGDNQNEVIRAVIVNSTFPNIRDNNGVSTAGQLYNVVRGYGRIDALRSFQTLAAGKIVKAGSTTAPRGWAYDSFPQNTASTHIYSVFGNKNERLIATLTWNRKFYNPYNPRALENLNLQILDPDGISVFAETGTKDNLEKGDILLPKTGFYQVKVTDNTAANLLQDYGLAFEIIPPIVGDFDLDYIVDHSDLAEFAQQWLLDDAGLSCDLAVPTGHIDFADFAVLASNWLIANNAYYEGY